MKDCPHSSNVMPYKVHKFVTILWSIYVTSPDLRERRTDFWNNKGRQALFKAMNVQPNFRKAKNMILFIGDGESEHQAASDV